MKCCAIFSKFFNVSDGYQRFGFSPANKSSCRATEFSSV